MMLSLVLSALAALPLAAPQDSLSEQVKEYKSILDDRERESEAIALIDAFTTRYAAHSERLVEIADMLEIEEGDAKALKKEAKDIADEQEDLADLIWLAFKERKRMTEGHRRLWKAAVFSFGQMGPHGAKHLWKVYGDKRFKDREEVGFRGTCIEQIGMTKDWDQWEDLVDLLDHHEDVIIAASATALKNYRGAPGTWLWGMLDSEMCFTVLTEEWAFELDAENGSVRRHWTPARQLELAARAVEAVADGEGAPRVAPPGPEEAADRDGKAMLLSWRLVWNSSSS